MWLEFQFYVNCTLKYQIIPFKLSFTRITSTNKQLKNKASISKLTIVQIIRFLVVLSDRFFHFSLLSYKNLIYSSFFCYF